MKKFLLTHRAYIALAIGLFGCVLTVISFYQLDVRYKVLNFFWTNWSTLLCMAAILFAHIIKARPAITTWVYLATLPNLVAIFALSLLLVLGVVHHGGGLVYVNFIIYPIIIIPVSMVAGSLYMLIRKIIKNKR